MLLPMKLFIPNGQNGRGVEESVDKFAEDVVLIQLDAEEPF